jgi:hypothetical protein
MDHTPYCAASFSPHFRKGGGELEEARKNRARIQILIFFFFVQHLGGSGMFLYEDKSWIYTVTSLLCDLGQVTSALGILGRICIK